MCRRFPCNIKYEKNYAKTVIETNKILENKMLS